MIRSMSCVVAAALVAPAALSHNHITIDTASGSRGDRILVRAGFNPSESAFAIEGGRLVVDGLPACYSVPDQFASGPFVNWYGGDEILLTSDYYFPTGRLNGGEFRWEIASIEPVRAGSTGLWWGVFEGTGEFTPLAFSQGAARSDRSFATPAGSHNHDQGYAFEAPGLFDVRFVVWDASGNYEDSEPVTIRFRVGPPCPADLNADGVVEDADFVVFLGAYNLLDCADPAMAFECPSDLNADGYVDDADFVLFVQAYDELVCP